MACKNGCYGCRKPEYGDRVRLQGVGFGTIWVISPDGMAFVAIGCRTYDVRLTELEFVSRKEG